ncbi:glycoside hydrolase family 127 protein [Sunxiuqinia indica]|uniref:glycoside hydrolase family 127 protein n=1 Tax=Sunxiuqinia indica TaxID=2692584 RepID=UPI001356C881|nr:beta-L-arabinofuranosidase domain-containing protein [Sunxiuqinia indica]
MKTAFILLLILGLLSVKSVQSQEKLYPNEFPLGDVTLLPSQFKNAEELNIKTLLEYDTDRLLEPFLTEAGLPVKGARFKNWSGLAGHVGGHYLSALAMNYAATGNTDCKERMDYMLSELKKCQDANGNGYLGGVPDSKAIWAQVKTGDFTLFHKAWVPWYNLHKTYAGLRDAWLYGKSELAKTMFLKLCDWGIDEISGLSTTQMQDMLNTEFGGMNEVYADAYEMTGDKKYLETAKKFTHHVLFDSMAKKVDNLDNLHANTQIPKVIGFARVAQFSPSDSDYFTASNFFWETVVHNRSLALGGNSRREHFPSAEACEDYVTSREGPESCNTYNMLKLTEDLFRIQPKAEYIDFYERALYNHILSTQNPETGGYVYFTPARPRHYRVYSAPNQAMWCCVGTGMENHGKYGQMIYTHNGSDSLFVNLFIPSVLNWKANGIELNQETNFPDDQSTKLMIAKGDGDFTMFIRHPKWVKADEFTVKINGELYKQASQPESFLAINRTWKAGDQIEITLPMHAHFEQLPNVEKYIALMYGPMLLGAKTSTQDLDGLIADDGRWSHIARGPLEELDKAPIIEGSRDSILQDLEPIKGKPLMFQAPGMFPDEPQYQSLVLEPFERIHDARYMMYWMSISRPEYASVVKALKAKEQEALELDERTIDNVGTGEQQPEADHSMKESNTSANVFKDEYYREASNGGYFSYQLATKGQDKLSLMVRYRGNENKNDKRSFDILVDGQVISTENVSNKRNKDDFVNVEYPIPRSLLKNKSVITVTFKGKEDNKAGRIFYLRLLKPDGEKP